MAVRHQVLAEKVLQQHKTGSSLSTIATANQISWEYAKEVLRYAQTGQPPRHRKSKRRKNRNPRQEDATTKTPPLFHQLADRVRHLRDEEHLPFPRILTLLRNDGIEVSVGTLRRAYDAARPDVVEDAVETGTPRRRGAFRHLSVDKIRQVQELLKQDISVWEIAQQTGVSASTVNRERCRRSEGEH